MVPLEWYGHPKKCTRKVLIMPFPYIFHVKNKGEAMPFSLKLKVNPKLGMLICGGTTKVNYWTWVSSEQQQRKPEFSMYENY